MPHYLVQAAYTADAAGAMVGNPQDRVEAVRPAVEALGGKVEAGYFSFGEFDIVFICEMPDNTTAAAFSLAAGAGGAVTALRTTPLLTGEEGVAAMQKASEAMVQILRDVADEFSATELAAA